jgi:glycosyltransferase involved in cell wall biosynthesis
MHPMTNGPVVSVVIDSYNYGRFIEEAIDSVLSQDFPEHQMEVLVVDDGSTDDTAERVRKYGSRVQYLYKPNGGQASAFNFGFAKARGEIIALLDGDDYWLPRKLRRIVEAFEKNPEVGMVYHPYLEVDMRTNGRRESKFLSISGSLFENKREFFWYHAPGTCASFRQKFLGRLLPIPERLRTQADGYIGLLIVFVAPILAIPECLATYRFHGRNLFHADESETSGEFEKSRASTTRMVIDAVDGWLRQHGYGRYRSFFNRFLLGLEVDRFAGEPPGRLRFFWFVVRENYTYSLIQTWKLTALNYVTALSALVFGYDKRHQMEEWRCSAVERAERLFRKFAGRRRNRVPAAGAGS